MRGGDFKVTQYNEATLQLCSSYLQTTQAICTHNLSSPSALLHFLASFLSLSHSGIFSSCISYHYAPSMESAAVLRSFNCSVSSVSHVQSILKRPCIVAVHNVSWPTLSKSQIQGSVLGGKLVSSPIRREGMKVSCSKTTKTTVATMSDVSSDDRQQGSHKKNPLPHSTFPSGFEAIILAVCDETDIAELKLKVGDFEMHLKRSICATGIPVAFGSHTTYAPPISSSLAIESAPASPPQPPSKSSAEKISPLINLSAEKSAKLAALEASGYSGYVFMKSPKVGSFRRGKKVNGQRKPPICTEGDVIREGQVIFFLDQFGSEFPVRSDVDGEILKVLFEEGEPVGYGDPIMAILPSFHDIN